MKIKVATAALVCAIGVLSVAASGAGKNPAPGNSGLRNQAQPPAPPPTASKETHPAKKAGTVIALEGSVSLIPAGGKAPVPLNVNDPISMGDRILTGRESNIYVLFADNTEFRLADNADLTVDDYVYDRNNTQSNKASYGLIEGMFKYVAGLIGKSGNADDTSVNIDTPVGAIRIRGAEFIVESDGTPDILEIALISGSIALTPVGGGTEPAPIEGPAMTGPLQIRVTPDGMQSLPMTQAQYNLLLAQYFPVAPTP